MAGEGRLIESVSKLLHLFFNQVWTICMEFGKSATYFDSQHAESCPYGRRNTEPSKLPALFLNFMHCHLDWPEKGSSHYPTTLNSDGKVSITCAAMPR